MKDEPGEASPMYAVMATASQKGKELLMESDK